MEHVLDICTAVSHPVIAADDLEQATVTSLIRKQEDLEVAKVCIMPRLDCDEPGTCPELTLILDLAFTVQDYRRFILVTDEVLPEGMDVAGVRAPTLLYS